MFYKKQELLTHCQHQTPEFTLGFSVRSVLLIFFVFCCGPIMCLYVQSSMLWCPLSFPFKKMFDSSLPPVVCRRAHVFFLRYLCLFSYYGVQHICVVFLFCFSLVASFSGFSIYDCPLQYSLTIIMHKHAANARIYIVHWWISLILFTYFEEITLRAHHTCKK